MLVIHLQRITPWKITLMNSKPEHDAGTFRALSSGGDSCPFAVCQEHLEQFKEVC